MKLKVWGGLVSCPRSHEAFKDCTLIQHRAIVRTTSQKRAVELLNQVNRNYSLNEFRNYWSVTGNDVELTVAASAGDEEGVWVSLSDRTRFAEDYKRFL